MGPRAGRRRAPPGSRSCRGRRPRRPLLRSRSGGIGEVGRPRGPVQVSPSLPRIPASHPAEPSPAQPVRGSPTHAAAGAGAALGCGTKCAPWRVDAARGSSLWSAQRGCGGISWRSRAQQNPSNGIAPPGACNGATPAWARPSWTDTRSALGRRRLSASACARGPATRVWPQPAEPARVRGEPPEAQAEVAAESDSGAMWSLPRGLVWESGSFPSSSGPEQWPLWLSGHRYSGLGIFGETGTAEAF